MIKSDVQENEGVNSLVKYTVDNAPKIQIPLVDARVRLRRELGVKDKKGGGGNTHAERMRSCCCLLDKCTAVDARATDDVTGTMCRWHPPAPSPQLLPEPDLKRHAVLQNPYLKPTPQKLWATPYSYAANHRIGKVLDLTGLICVGDVVDGSIALVVCERLRSLCSGPLAVVSDTPHGQCVRLVQPLQFSSVLQMIADNYEDANERKNKIPLHFVKVDWTLIPEAGKMVPEASVLEVSIVCVLKAKRKVRRQGRGGTKDEDHPGPAPLCDIGDGAITMEELRSGMGADLFSDDEEELTAEVENEFVHALFEELRAGGDEALLEAYEGLIADDEGEFKRAVEDDRRANDDDIVDEAERAAAGAATEADVVAAGRVADAMVSSSAGVATLEEVGLEATLDVVWGVAAAGGFVEIAEDAAAATADNMRSTVRLWRNELKLSLSALQERADAMLSKEIGQDGEISLVVPKLTADAEGTDVQPSAVFVAWRDPTARSGRQVGIDPLHRIKYSVPLFRLAQWDGCFIIHPAIGVRMRRVPPALRQALPMPVQRLQRMWNASLGAVESFAPCSVCNRAEADAKDGGLPKLCPLCMVVSHSSCADDVLCEDGGASAMVDGADVMDGLQKCAPERLPGIFWHNDNLCALCRNWQG